MYGTNSVYSYKVFRYTTSDFCKITDDQRDEAQYNGYTVVDLSTVIATHLTEVLKSNLYELFGRQELVTILDDIELEIKLLTKSN